MPPPRWKTKKRKSGWPRLIFAVLVCGGGIIWIILHSGGNDGHIDLFGTTATRIPAARIVETVTPQIGTQTASAVQTAIISPETSEPIPATDELDTTPTSAP